MALARSFISPEDLYPGREVTYQELSSLAATLNRDEALKFLGFVNLVLSAATTETHLTNNLQPIHEVQTWLFREVVSESLLADLKAKFRDASLLDRPLLHRTQVLFAIRLVASHGDPLAGNSLKERRDFDAVGDLLFQINGLFRVDPPTSEAATSLWIATQMGPMYKTENPPSIELSWPRIEELLMQRLPAAAPDPAELERLERVSVFTTGFSTRAWIDLSWMLFSLWAVLKFKDLMTNIGHGYFDPARPHPIISTETLKTAVEGLGVSFAQLPTHLKIETYSRDALFDLTPFRIRPLWLMPDGLVTCVDAALLMERLGPHMFWGIMNSLDTSERRKQFTSMWGQAFENYCLDALSVIFKGKKWLYSRNPIDQVLNEEFADALAVRDDVVIIMECKGTFIRSGDKYSGSPGRFMRGLSQKFGCGKHGGVHQLVRGISRVWFRKEVGPPIARPHAVSDVFPVLIVQDPVVNCGPVARVLSDRCWTALRRASRGASKSPKIWPLTVIGADDLDRLVSIVEVTGQRLDSILKRFHRLHPSRIVSLSDFLSSEESGEFGLRESAQERVRQRFTAATQGTVQRFRDARVPRAELVIGQPTRLAFA